MAAMIPSRKAAIRFSSPTRCCRPSAIASVSITACRSTTPTRIFRYEFREGAAPAGGPVPVETVAPFKDEAGEYILGVNFAGQDAMAYESQGAVADRTQEYLTAADRGILLYRKMLAEQIDAVEKGKDPVGLIRDPALDQIIRIDVSAGQGERARKTGIVY